MALKRFLPCLIFLLYTFITTFYWFRTTLILICLYFQPIVTEIFLCWKNKLAILYYKQCIMYLIKNQIRNYAIIQLFFYIITIHIETFVTEWNKCLHALLLELCNQSIKPLRDCCLDLFRWLPSKNSFKFGKCENHMR